MRTSPTLLAAAVGALILAPAAQAQDNVSPTCAKPGQSLPYHAVFDHYAPDRIVLTWAPRLIDPKTGQPASEANDFKQDAGTIVFATRADASSPTGSVDVADGSVTLPTTKTFGGMVVDSWDLLGQFTDGSGKEYVTGGEGRAYVDIDEPRLQLPKSVKRGSIISVRARGLGKGAVTARLLKGKKSVATTKLRPTTAFPCGLAFGSITGTSDLKKGTYTVVVGKTKASVKIT